MKIDWKSVKNNGYPPAPGRYLVTVEGAIEDMDEGPAPGERAVTAAYYYGSRGWGLLEWVVRVVAWAELPEGYIGE